MVFTIAEAIKDWLVDHNVKKMSVHELAVQRKQATKGIDNALAEDESDDEKLFSTENTVKVDTEEEAERRAHYGTPFSMELFEAWRVDYEAYVLEKDELERKHKEDPERANRPTGKHFFEQRSAQHLSTLSNGNVGQEDSKEVYWFDDELYNDDDISE